MDDSQLLHIVRDAVDQIERVDLPNPSKAICDKHSCPSYAFFQRCYSDVYTICAIYNEKPESRRLPLE